MKEQKETLADALGEYQKAKAKLSKFMTPFKYEIDTETGIYTLSCPNCGACFFKGRYDMAPQFLFPIICCGRLMV